jgi:hypothetical protein
MKTKTFDRKFDAGEKITDELDLARRSSANLGRK